MPEITDETTFTVRDDVVTEEIEDELVILDLEGDVYFSLNEVGRVIWEQAADGQSFSEVVDAVCEQYEVERETAAEDAKAFLGEALDEDLMDIDEND